MITSSLINDLRRKTNIGMIECKKALTETNGDLDAAVRYLREQGLLKAGGIRPGKLPGVAVSAERVCESGDFGIRIELCCETDFVASHEFYLTFVGEIATLLAASTATTLEEALAIKSGGITVEGLVKSKVLELGENIVLAKFERFNLKERGTARVDPLSGKPLHVDFPTIDEKTEITAHIPLYLIGEPAGVKAGGLLVQISHTLEVRCTAAELPEALEFDVAHLNEGDRLRIGDVKLPVGVTATHGVEFVIAYVESAATVMAAELLKLTAATDETASTASLQLASSFPNRFQGPGWNGEKNAVRCALIEKEISGTLSEVEASLLANLQAEMIEARNKLFPLPLEELRKIREELFESSAAQK